MNVSRRSSVKASVGVKEIFPESKLALSYNIGLIGLRSISDE